MRHTLSQADYYKTENFNPTEFLIETDKAFRAYFQKRMNLYAHRLNIPQGFWKNRSVLEVGCSSGENALVLASLGAQFTFVDPMEMSLARLKELFQLKGFSRSIRQLIVGEIQQVPLKESYDCVIAEGFLYTLAERRAVINKLFEHLNPYGLLFISTLEPIGCFVEFFKKTVLFSLCRQEKVNRVEEKLKIAAELFEEDFKKIPHSRPFASWIKDNFLNPTFDYASLWGIPEILSDITSGPVRVFSSWPHHAHANELTWYKSVLSLSHEKKVVLEAYTKRLSSFLHGKTLEDGFPLPSLKQAEKFERAVLKMMRRMHFFMRAESASLLAVRGALEEVHEISKELPDHNALLPVINDCLRVLAQPSVKAYKRARHLRECWGVCYPYYVLQRIHR